MQIIKYFATLSKGKTILWCYLIWYLVAVFFYFDADIRIWINSAGLSLVIGIALVLSVSGKEGSTIAGKEKRNRWQVFRLFAMPFFVSSFSSLIKNQGFMLIIPSNPIEQIVAVGSCILFVLFVVAVKKLAKQQLFR